MCVEREFWLALFHFGHSPSPSGTFSCPFPADSLSYARGTALLCRWFRALSLSSPLGPSFPVDASIASSSKAGSRKASVVAGLNRQALDRQLLRVGFFTALVSFT